MGPRSRREAKLLVAARMVDFEGPFLEDRPGVSMQVCRLCTGHVCNSATGTGRLHASPTAAHRALMAASKGKNGKAKVKAAAKKASVKKAVAPPPKSSASASTVVSVEPPQKRRQVARRHTDEQVDRAMSGKLGHIPPAVLEGKTNSKGLTIREYVAQAFKQASGKQGRLGSKFRCRVNEEFCLTHTSDPPPGEQLDSELVEMIHLCHHENPAARRTVALERYLEYCKPLNRLSLFGGFARVAGVADHGEGRRQEVPDRDLAVLRQERVLARPSNSL